MKFFKLLFLLIQLKIDDRVSAHSNICLECDNFVNHELNCLFCKELLATSLFFIMQTCG